MTYFQVQWNMHFWSTSFLRQFWKPLLGLVGSSSRRTRQMRKSTSCYLMIHYMQYYFLEGPNDIRKWMFFTRSFQLHTVFNLDNDNGAEDTPTLIDRKVILHRWKFFWRRLPLCSTVRWLWITDDKSLTDASPCSHQDNVFIMSNPKSKFPVLQLDLRLAYSSFPHPGYYGTLKLCNRKKNLLGC